MKTNCVHIKSFYHCVTLICIYTMRSEIFIFCYYFSCLLKYHRQENLSFQSVLRSIEVKADSSIPGEKDFPTSMAGAVSADVVDIALLEKNKQNLKFHSH